MGEKITEFGQNQQLKNVISKKKVITSFWDRKLHNPVKVWIQTMCSLHFYGLIVLCLWSSPLYQMLLDPSLHTSKAFFSFLALGYIHQTVNHARNFVAQNGVHTNDIESLWSACKSKFKRMHGSHRSFIPSYLDELMWRRKRTKGQILGDILKEISLQYPLP